MILHWTVKNVNQLHDLQRLVVDFDIFGFVVRIDQMTFHPDHCQRWRMKLELVGMLHIDVDHQFVGVAVVPIGLVESLIKR